jgi:hypothetical protein
MEGFTYMFPWIAPDQLPTVQKSEGKVTVWDPFMNVSLFGFATGFRLSFRPGVQETDEAVLFGVLSVAGTFAKAYKVLIVEAGG